MTVFSNFFKSNLNEIFDRKLSLKICKKRSLMTVFSNFLHCVMLQNKLKGGSTGGGPTFQPGVNFFLGTFRGQIDLHLRAQELANTTGLEC